MRQPPDKWYVQGRVVYSDRPSFAQRVSTECDSEEQAWRLAMSIRLECVMCDMVIVSQTYRPFKGREGQWRPVNKVIWRCGAGKAWFE